MVCLFFDVVRTKDLWRYFWRLEKLQQKLPQDHLLDPLPVRTDKRTDGRMYGRTDRWTNGRTNYLLKYSGISSHSLLGVCIVKFLNNDKAYVPIRATLIGCGGTGKTYILNMMLTIIRNMTGLNTTPHNMQKFYKSNKM